MLGRSSGLSCHVSPEKLSEAFKMSFRLCQVGMFFLDIAVVIGLRSQLSLISVTRCHRDYNFATAFDVWVAVQFCSCTVVGCRSFWNPSVRREPVNSLSCTWWPAPISEKNRMRKQSEKAKWNWHLLFPDSGFTIFFIVWKQISWSLTSSTSASPRSGDYVKESHGQRIGQAGSFMWHMFFHPRIDWILADLSLATPRCHDAWRRPQVELPKDHPYLSLLADEKHEKYEKQLRKAGAFDWVSLCSLWVIIVIILYFAVTFLWFCGGVCVYDLRPSASSGTTTRLSVLSQASPHGTTFWNTVQRCKKPISAFFTWLMRTVQ